ncbi:response regulator [Methanocalculus taiwanensis]|uniref:Response regulator n=1 Tax=Methanocalculus taiwanensis TaxID=106207 RepID=A0ABD4TFR7_9EURY|nr:response regulator [Methanocalculus taiwanensis]MCQ1537496.1 response regulator [Methanocalculus taiwanensis]
MSTATILIVEDEAITALAIKKTLLKLGYSVCGIVPKADLAVLKAREQNPDLILMDIRLAGEKTGIEAAAEILAHQSIPVIYLTAFSDDHYLKEAKKTEPYGYLLKPVHDQELKATIEMALHKHAMELGRQRRAEKNATLMNEMVLPQLTRNDILNEVSTILHTLGLSREMCVSSKQAEYHDQIQAASQKIQERMRFVRKNQKTDQIK